MDKATQQKVALTLLALVAIGTSRLVPSMAAYLTHLAVGILSATWIFGPGQTAEIKPGAPANDVEATK